MKQEDTKALEITFGVELETLVPRSLVTTGELRIGDYHRGHPVESVRCNGSTIDAPKLATGACWVASSDASIKTTNEARMMDWAGCEFVSPILRGDEGVENLVNFAAFLQRIGAKVNSTCGCHIHVGVKSVVGQDASEAEVMTFLVKVAAISQRFGLALYAQTGSPRHRLHFCQPVGDSVRRALEQARRNGGWDIYGGSMLGFEKYTLLNILPYKRLGTIEFRAFAGTRNPAKLLSHLATCLGICRYAHVVRAARWVGPNNKYFWQGGGGENTLRYLWGVLGWKSASSASTHAFGLAGKLYQAFDRWHVKALDMAKKFDTRYPDASPTPEPSSTPRLPAEVPATPAVSAASPQRPAPVLGSILGFGPAEVSPAPTPDEEAD